MHELPLEAWHDLFVASSGCAAALAGLLFVAVSINIARILEFPGVPGRAAEALLFLIGVVVVSIAGLVPEQRSAAFGMEVLAVGVVILAISATFQVQAVRGGGQQATWIASRVLCAVVSIAPWLIGGVGLLLGAEAALYWLPVGIIGSVLAGVWDAWIMLVEILR